MDAMQKALQPLYEFGALTRFLEENGKTKEFLKLHTKYNDLSRIYYMVIENLTGAAAQDFEAREELAYCRFIMNLDEELKKWLE